MNQVQQTNAVFHNAVVKVDTEAGRISFDAGAHEFSYKETTAYFKDGDVGQLRRDLENHKFTFWPYPDQRLRRAPEYDVDEPFVHLWGWTIQEASGVLRAFTAKAEVTPGKDGRVIDDDTQPVEIDVPPEFLELCEEFGVTAEQVLKGFIGDLCGLQNYIQLPRADGYGSHGSDERDMAAEYFRRTYYGRTKF